jgi:hypothetical protein
MSNLESNVFGKKKFSDILKEIYDNQKKKEQQITALIGKPLINDIGDATLIVPLIKEYMELGIKNDEQLIKMATIIQRALATGKSEDEGFGMTEDEKAQLMAINRINNTGKVQNQLPDHSTVYGSLKNDISGLNSFIVVARVTDIVLNDRHEFFSQVGEYNGIGAIFYEIVNESGTNTDNNGSVNFALPHDSQLKVYPLINEYVVLINIPNNKTGNLSSSTSYFYLSPVNIWNHPHHDAYPNPSTQLPYSKTKDDYTSLGVSGSIRRASTDNEYFPDSELNSKRNLSQNTFIEKADIHPLLPFMGDALLEGRHGQSLRFGSTAKPPSPVPILEIDNNWSSVGKNGDPITILRNGQPTNVSDKGWIPITENLSNDLSSIYLTSYQKIPFKV